MRLGLGGREGGGGGATDREPIIAEALALAAAAFSLTSRKRFYQLHLDKNKKKVG